MLYIPFQLHLTCIPHIFSFSVLCRGLFFKVAPRCLEETKTAIYQKARSSPQWHRCVARKWLHNRGLSFQVVLVSGEAVWTVLANRAWEVLYATSKPMQLRNKYSFFILSLPMMEAGDDDEALGGSGAERFRLWSLNHWMEEHLPPTVNAHIGCYRGETHVFLC